MAGRDVTVYHYTDKRGKEAIERSGRIQPSSDGAYGPGVYVTTIPPSEGRKAVSQNNWDGNWRAVETQGRADYAIQMKIPANQLRDPGSQDRNILIHDGPVKLNDVQYKAMKK